MRKFPTLLDESHIIHWLYIIYTADDFLLATEQLMTGEACIIILKASYDWLMDWSHLNVFQIWQGKPQYSCNSSQLGQLCFRHKQTGKKTWWNKFHLINVVIWKKDTMLLIFHLQTKEQCWETSCDENNIFNRITYVLQIHALRKKWAHCHLIPSLIQLI